MLPLELSSVCVPGGASQTRLVASAVTEKKVSRRGSRTHKSPAGSQVKRHRRNKGPSCCARPCFCLGRVRRYCMAVAGGACPCWTGDSPFCPQSQYTANPAGGFGPVVIHPQASPDAHLCCGSTLHTMTSARAAITIIIPSLSSLLLLPTAVPFYSRFCCCV